MQSFSKTQSGFFLVEVVVATALVATIIIFMLGLVQDIVKVSQASLERTQASYLLEEGEEAVKTIRDDAWTNISSINNGVNQYLAWNGTKWTFSSTDSPIGQFSRVVVFDSVYRDANDDITTSGGTVDTRTRKITVTVSWNTTTGTKTESLVFYIADIRT
ncbi:MAG: hypothetical protein AAB681_00765 [Patescibacteria group bacterium]